MIDKPHFGSYSIPARICAVVAIGGGMLLGLLAFMGAYFTLWPTPSI
jgi:hypothetical protein